MVRYTRIKLTHPPEAPQSGATGVWFLVPLVPFGSTTHGTQITQ